MAWMGVAKLRVKEFHNPIPSRLVDLDGEAGFDGLYELDGNVDGNVAAVVELTISGLVRHSPAPGCSSSLTLPCVGCGC